MPLVNGCTFPLKKVKAIAFAIAAQLNPTASEKIDAAALRREQNKKTLLPISFLSQVTNTHRYTIFNSSWPYQTGIKRRGNINPPTKKLHFCKYN